MMGTELVKYEHQNSIKPKSRKKPVFRSSRAYAALTRDERQIIDAALEAREQWREAGLNFNNVTDDLLVDYYIYWMKACESRYTYYLRLAKERGLSHYL